MKAIKTLIIGCVMLMSVQSFATSWRDLDPQQALLLELSTGKVVIELNHKFAPKHAAQVTKLARQGFYKDLNFYRVIDGFVAQGGYQGQTNKAKLPLESDRQLGDKDTFIALQTGDLFAAQTGFIDDFAVGVDNESKQTWLLHCPGTVGMSRENTANSATTDFYITIGQAPRYLDRIMSIFGRVVYGMEHVQKLNRTQEVEGEDNVRRDNYSKLINLRLMSDVPKSEQINLQVENTNSDDFAVSMQKRKHRDHPFFFKKPPAVLDVCQIPLNVRVKSNL